MLKRGVVTPEKNTGLKLAIKMNTRSPLEAFQMLRVGHPIDVMAGYYEDQISPDFYMMDKIQKLHALAEYKQKAEAAKADISAFENDLKARENEEKQKAEAEKREADIQEAARKLVTKQMSNNEQNKES